MGPQVRNKVTTAIAVGAVAAVTAAAAPAASAAKAERPVTVVGEGLSDPFGLERAHGERRGLLVAEGGAGEVTRVFLDGRQRTILDGVPGVAGVAAGPRRVFAVTGEHVPPGAKVARSRVVRMDYRGGQVEVIANLYRHELRKNPDGQKQFDDEGKPYDAISNPFAVEWSKFGLFVADGGANDILRVHPGTGKVRTFFAPRTFKDTKQCRDAGNANPGTTGCDPVATGVFVRGKSVYASFLGAEAPGAGRVYKLNARTGKVQRVWKGLTSPTGVAVTRSGTVFTSHVLEGAPDPSGPPPPDFDPAAVGEITRIKDGKRTHAQVTMPTGLAFHKGKLYASAWSIASFLGMENRGEVVRVRKGAFS